MKAELQGENNVLVKDSSGKQNLARGSCLLVCAVVCVYMYIAPIRTKALDLRSPLIFRKVSEFLAEKKKGNTMYCRCNQTEFLELFHHRSAPGKSMNYFGSLVPTLLAVIPVAST